jgi:hypothetical protein
MLVPIQQAWRDSMHRALDALPDVEESSSLSLTSDVEEE